MLKPFNYVQTNELTTHLKTKLPTNYEFTNHIYKKIK